MYGLALCLAVAAVTFIPAMVEKHDTDAINLEVLSLAPPPASA